MKKSDIQKFIKASAEVDALKARLKIAEARKRDAESALIASLDAGDGEAMPRKDGKSGVDVVCVAHGYIVRDCRFEKEGFDKARVLVKNPELYAECVTHEPRHSFTVKPETA